MQVAWCNTLRSRGGRCEADLNALLLAREHAGRVYQRDLLQQLVGAGSRLKLRQEAVAVLRQPLRSCTHTLHQVSKIQPGKVVRQSGIIIRT
jgi:hypothetical protein